MDRDFWRYAVVHIVGVPALFALAALWAYRSGGDVQLAQAFFDAQTQQFPLGQSRIFEALGHRLVLVVPVGLGALVFAGMVAGFFVDALRPFRGVLLAMLAVLLLGPLLVGQLKYHTTLPRPMHMQMFGGYAPWPEHWWTAVRAQAGGALPSGHAAGGYALLCIYFAGRALRSPRLQRAGLVLGLGCGALFSFVRIAQGAHFLSQTLWSGTVLWAVAGLSFLPLAALSSKESDVDNFSSPLHPAGAGRMPAKLAYQALDSGWRRLASVQVLRRQAMWAMGILVVLASLFVGSQATGGMHQAVEMGGMMLIFTAILGRAWCTLYLGGRKGSQLMTQGPYSLSRNPLYVFSAIGAAGIGAQTGSLAVAVLMALLVLAVFARVVSEEEMLLAHAFPGAFDAYRNAVPRFVPRLSGWHSDAEVAVSLPALGRTLRDALPYLLAVPVFELIEQLQYAGLLPVMLRLP